MRVSPVRSVAWLQWQAGYAALLMAALLMAAVALSDEALDDQFFIQQVQTRYVEPFKAGDIERWSSAFAEDAVALHNFRDADRGRDAIRAFGEVVHELFFLDRYEVQVTDVRQRGRWAYTVGTYTSLLVSKLDGTEPFGLQRGKFVLLWEQAENGHWLIALDMGNSSE